MLAAEVARGTRRSVPPWMMAVGAMLSVQLGTALSVGLIGQVGPAGTAWLRLSMGGLIFIALVRPRLRAVRRDDVPVLVLLGLMTGLLATSYMAAIARIPLGTAVAIEFLGPLTVAAVRSPRRSALAWPALALAGVLLLTEPWKGEINLPGVGFAALSAVGWGGYILLTARAGDRFTGVTALSFTVPLAAVTAGTAGVGQAWGAITPQVLLTAFCLALLLPVIPFTLEMIALRRMNQAAFGTLMALEPAIGVLLGLIVLRQVPSATQLAGVALVVLAGAAAQRGGRRTGETRPGGSPPASPVCSPHPAAAP